MVRVPIGIFCTIGALTSTPKKTVELNFSKLFLKHGTKKYCSIEQSHYLAF